MPAPRPRARQRATTARMTWRCLQTLGIDRPPQQRAGAGAVHQQRHQPPALPAGADLAAVSGAAVLGQPRLAGRRTATRCTTRPDRVRGDRDYSRWLLFATGLIVLAAVRRHRPAPPPGAGIRASCSARPLTDRDAPLPASDTSWSVHGKRPQLRMIPASATALACCSRGLDRFIGFDPVERRARSMRGRRAACRDLALLAVPRELTLPSDAGTRKRRPNRRRANG